MSTEVAAFALLVVASLVAIAARRLAIPYSPVLVLAGMAIRALPDDVAPRELRQLHLTPELFRIFLPILLFEASFHLSWTKFRSSARAILLLAIPGVVLAVIVGGGLTYFLERATGTEVPLGVAFLFAGLLAATDPVSVVALFKELGVPKRLAVIVEGESLLNDAIGVVAFTVCAGLVGVGATQGPITAGWLGHFLLVEIGGGLAIGLAVGLALSWATTWVDDHLIEIMITTVAAFGSFLAADVAGASPILAVVAAGMACGNVATRYGMTPTNRIAIESFWEYCVFVSNGFVFLLVGEAIDLTHVASNWLPIVTAWIALTLARTVVVVIVERALSRSSERFPTRWSAVLVWGGLRGALSMVLALSIGEQLAERSLVLDLTFGVVLLTIVVQGMTMTPVLRWARALAAPAEQNERQRLRVALHALRAALVHLDKSFAQGGIDEATHDAMRARLAGRQLRLEKELESADDVAECAPADLERIDRELRDVERKAVEDAATRGELARDAVSPLLRELDTGSNAGADLETSGSAASDSDEREDQAGSGSGEA